MTRQGALLTSKERALLTAFDRTHPELQDAILEILRGLAVDFPRTLKPRPLRIGSRACTPAADPIQRLAANLENLSKRERR